MTTRRVRCFFMLAGKGAVYLFGLESAMRWLLTQTGFESLRDGLILKAAGAPQAPFFLLLAQKKEGKEKGTLLTRPGGFSARLAAHGAKRTRR